MKTSSRQTIFSQTLLSAALLISLSSFATEIVLTPQKPGGIVEVGEAVEWRVEISNPPTPPIAQVHYALKKGGLTILKEGTLDLSAGPATLKASLDEPGTILAEVKATVDGKEIKSLAGVAVAPNLIKLSAPRPDDFDAFWQAKIEQLNAVPENGQVESADSGNPAVDYFKVRLDNIRETHVYGQLARPKNDAAKDAKYPALLLVQYAGIYPLPKNNVVGRAAQGWLTFNIMAHDLPFDQPDAFYKEQSQGKLKDYLAIGDEDRDASYFLRMYLGCYRAVEFLSHRPDWDGKTIVVMGTSQGGQQALVTAALNPKITAMLANVPAGCDTTGPWAGRAAGFPYWSAHAKWRGKPDADKRVMETSRYYDTANLAARIKCPALVALGLIDETCPPSGVFSAFNQMQGPKEAVVMVNSDHQGHNHSQKQWGERSDAWLKALLAGQKVPVK